MVSDMTAGCVQCWCFVTYLLGSYTVKLGTVQEAANAAVINHMEYR